MNIAIEKKCKKAYDTYLFKFNFRFLSFQVQTNLVKNIHHSLGNSITASILLKVFFHIMTLNFITCIMILITTEIQQRKCAVVLQESNDCFMLLT